jgi:hypothetical protein
MGGTLWKVVDEDFIFLNEANPTQASSYFHNSYICIKIMLITSP